MNDPAKLLRRDFESFVRMAYRDQNEESWGMSPICRASVAGSPRPRTTARASS